MARWGVHSEVQEGAFSRNVVAELAGLVSQCLLTVPISAVQPLEQDAYRQAQRRHTRGKIALSLVSEEERPAGAGRVTSGL